MDVMIYPTNPTTSPGHFRPQMIALAGIRPPTGASTRILPLLASTSATYTNPMMLASRMSESGAFGATWVMARRVFARADGGGEVTFFNGTFALDADVDAAALLLEADTPPPMPGIEDVVLSRE